MRYNLRSPHRWVGTPARQQRARDTVGSTSIEGIHVSREAAMAHLNLVIIHPCSDGDGRLSRILQSWRLYKDRRAETSFVSVEEYLGRNTETYYVVLAEVGAGQWSPERDASPWLEFMLTAHYRRAMTSRRRIEAMEQVARHVDVLIDSLPPPPRAAAPLEFALTNWRLTNALHRDAAGVPRPTASRDLRLLTQAGVLVRHGDKRGAVYAPSFELQHWLEQTRRQAQQRFDVAADPYRSLRRGNAL